MTATAGQMMRFEPNRVSTLYAGYLFCTVYVDGLNEERRSVNDIAVLHI